MDRSIGRALTLAGALGLLSPVAEVAWGFPVHLPGHHAKPQVAANEGLWFIRAGGAQDIYANVGRKPLPVQAYVCTKPDGPGAPRVELQVLGRAAIDIQGCQSLYLLLNAGERITLLNPNPAAVNGSYKMDVQSAIK